MMRHDLTHSRPNRKAAAPLLVAALIAAGAIGCNQRSDIGTVTGKVTYGGQPLRAVEVQFDPVGPGRNSVGYTNADGEYTLQYTASQAGALVGQHNVAVFDRSGQTSIPAEFTRLTFEVKPGSNRFDIEIPGP